VYLAAGRPIVATKFGDYGKVLGATGAGRLTPVSAPGIADGILDVLNNPELAASLAAACEPVAREHFGMDRNVDRYLAVYERAMGVNRSRVSRKAQSSTSASAQ
jgi:glycosyltransferase involved in cell wall biosynthesis